ncbi:MAG: isoprenylcysteine carboxylmethyltransferase family protein, partial [Bacteroidales bacterium]|nr:isoprenylcysteine carboxylmethyltransferase family protein [Bacteroidales bacterium]
LKQSLEKNGSFLFRFRGQIPLFVFILGLPFIYYTYFTDNYTRFEDFFGSALPYFWTIISVVSIFVSVFGLLIRAYTIGTTPRGTSGRNTKQQVAEELNTKGIYSVVRHPLYVGNYLMWAGLLIFVANIYLFIIASLLYWIYYERIMFTEECYLESKFGEQFIRWSLGVPAFIPAFRKFVKGEVPFSFKAVLRREYSGFFAITLCFTIVDYVRYYAYTLHEKFATSEWIRPSLICLLLTGLIMIVLRTLKHHSRVLHPEENRD